MRHPDLPGRFYAAGPGRAQQMLEAIIAEAIEAGTLRACDPQEAADELAGLWLGMTSGDKTWRKTSAVRRRNQTAG